jgi:hypothetical protein
MDIQQTRSRLRRTFAYPSDDHSLHSDDEDGAALDEQEQEDLITSLTTQNHAANERFRLFLLALPLLSTAPYLVALFSSRRSSGISHILALLALTSLASTAWLLYAQLPGATGLAALDRWAAGTGARDTLHGDHGTHVPTARRHRRGSFSVPDAVASLGPGTAGEFAAGRVAVVAGPLALWLPYLNVGLCGVLVVAGLVAPAAGASAGSWGHVGLTNLPAVVYAVVLLAKMVMGGVDPERELSGLKYDYKGA